MKKSNHREFLSTKVDVSLAASQHPHSIQDPIFPDGLCRQFLMRFTQFVMNNTYIVLFLTPEQSEHKSADRCGKAPLSHCSAPAQKHCWHVRRRRKRSLCSGTQRHLSSCFLHQQLKLQKESTISHLISLALDGSLGGRQV